MFFTLFVMATCTCIGFLALFLITGDLAKRGGLGRPARILLSAGLGMGVIAISIKVLLVGVLMETTKDHHPEFADVERSGLEGVPGGFDGASYTGRWYALPKAAPTPDGVRLRDDVVSLGRRLFNDRRLSADGKVACASCHDIGAGGDDGRSVAAGIDGLQGTRNVPTVWNAAFLSRLFWDGRAASLEEQAEGPLLNPVEMGMASHGAVEAAVRADPTYRDAFQQLFGGDATIERIVSAIGSYERTLISPETAYDRFVRGVTGALTTQQVRGMALFAGLGCRRCHRDPTFSAAGRIRPAGVRKPFPIFTNADYVARYDLLADRGASPRHGGDGPGLWRVPSLRNVANTAPYFHNGSVATLEEAVRVMAATQLNRRPVTGAEDEVPSIIWDPATRKLTPYRPKVLTAADIDAIVAFLRSLSIERDDMGKVAGDKLRPRVAVFSETDSRISANPLY
ncbi:cytochrome c peroxidase [uncultured Roseibium sp.]|uniref:cytochrome-c peroxidase n=1 Tax=uncultured Roseibium sp. TaxID=1936171 RepID=UPI003217154C